MREPDAEIDELARRVIGAAIEVHRRLNGPGFLESVYETALAIELDFLGIPYERQKIFRIPYRNQVAGEGRLDFLVDGRLVVELKAVDKVIPIHFATVKSYLKAFDEPLGLILNFRVPLMRDGIHRVVWTQ
ncbi:MAG: GxxExxY protein [Planctomycetota bacterium]